MTVAAYSRAALCKEYAMALGGLALAGMPLAFLELAPAAAWMLAAATLVFAAHAAGIAHRHLTRVSFDDSAIQTEAPWGARLPWRDIRDVRLRYFSTRRDGASGWMVLTVRGDRGRIRIGSALDGFQAIAERAARSVRENAIALDHASVRNFRHLGIPVHEGEP